MKSLRLLWLVPIFCALASSLAATEAATDPMADEAADLDAARALFEANLDAIRRRDRDAYLACYLESETLARGGPGGVALGFEELAAAAGEGWPDHFDAQDLQLVPVRPGVVYGTYRYRVHYGETEVTGLSERVFRDTPDGWRIAVTTAFPDPPGTPPPARALLGATLVDGTGAPPLADAVVLLRGGRIECAGTRAECPVPAAAEPIDLSGHWIVPGLVDAHVHFSQTGWADGRPDSLDVREMHPYAAVQADLRARPERWYRAYLCSGVTAVFDVGGYPWTWELRQRAARDPRAPHIAAAGPLLSTRDHWLNLPAERQFLYLADENAARHGVEYLVAHGTDAVKVWFLSVQDREAAELDAVVLAAGAAADRAEVPLIVHATELREAKVALQAGARILVHSVWDQPVDDVFVELAKEHGTIYCPTLTVLRGYQRMYDAAGTGKAPEVDDPNGCVDAEILDKVASTAELGEKLDSRRLEPEVRARRAEALAERERIATQNLSRLAQEGIVIAMGTDAGNPLTLPGPSVYAEMEAMQAAGLTPMEVLVASTLGGARAMGKAEEIGTVESGKVADLLIVAADPMVDVSHLRQLRFVVRGGEIRPLAELVAPRSVE